MGDHLSTIVRWCQRASCEPSRCFWKARIKVLCVLSFHPGKRYPAIQSNSHKQDVGCFHTLKPTNNFLRYNGPEKSKRTQKRDEAYGCKVNLSPHFLFIDINYILRTSLAGLDLVSKFAGETLEEDDKRYVRIAMHMSLRRSEVEASSCGQWRWSRRF